MDYDAGRDSSSWMTTDDDDDWITVDDNISPVYFNVFEYIQTLFIVFSIRIPPEIMLTIRKYLPKHKIICMGGV